MLRIKTPWTKEIVILTRKKDRYRKLCMFYHWNMFTGVVNNPATGLLDASKFTCLKTRVHSRSEYERHFKYFGCTRNPRAKS